MQFMNSNLFSSLLSKVAKLKYLVTTFCCDFILMVNSTGQCISDNKHFKIMYTREKLSGHNNKEVNHTAIFTCLSTDKRIST